MSRNPGRRLVGHDYSSPGWYFITIVVEGRRRLFGTLVPDGTQLSPLGTLTQQAWGSVLDRWPWVQCRHMVLMPDHLHALIGWYRRPGRRNATLGRFVAQFKSESVRQAVSRRELPSWDRFWQEGFWDRVIRTRHELERVERYIQLNPVRAALLLRNEGRD